jgi:hypothetical protein
MSRSKHLKALRRRADYLADVRLPRQRSPESLSYDLAELAALRWALRELGEATDREGRA